MQGFFRKLIFEFVHASESTHSELSYKKIPIKKFWKLMEKFQFYLNPVHFFILFFDFKVRLKWDKSKIQKQFSEKKSVFFADLPHTRPFPWHWVLTRTQNCSAKIPCVRSCGARGVDAGSLRAVGVPSRAPGGWPTRILRDSLRSKKAGTKLAQFIFILVSSKILFLKRPWCECQLEI